jgi:hypothetical protein
MDGTGGAGQIGQQGAGLPGGRQGQGFVPEPGAQASKSLDAQDGLFRGASSAGLVE